MYRCEKCGYQSEPYETQHSIITRRELEKGWEIESIKKVCYKCSRKAK